MTQSLEARGNLNIEIEGISLDSFPAGGPFEYFPSHMEGGKLTSPVIFFLLRTWSVENKFSKPHT